MGKEEDLLSVETSADRYAEELRQAQALLGTGSAEGVWGWTGRAGAERAARRAEFLIRQAGLKPGVTCLELGCGTGQFTARLLASGCALTAVELSAATAAVCRQRVAGKAEILVGNIETGEGLQGRTFDAIVGVSVLHHLNMGLCLKNTFALLKLGGRFAFSEPNMNNPQVWAQLRCEAIRKWRACTKHETAFRSRQMRRLFEEAGFQVTLCEPYEFLHPATPGCCVGMAKFCERILEATPFRAIAGSIRIAGTR
jgi:SAM-dependent methyltransferase